MTDFFATYLPAEPLQPFVRAFVVTEKTGEEVYKVLPDTGLVIGFQYRGSLSKYIDDAEQRLDRSGISGMHDRYWQFKTDAYTGTVLVIFKEGGAAAFFKRPLHELFGESVSLDNFMLRSELMILEEQLAAAKNNESKIGIIEQFLLQRMDTKNIDPLIPAAITLIYQHKGVIRIAALASELHISQSPLEKRFRQGTGISPKKFASIVRFKHAIAHYHSQNSLTGLGYEAGFYDQAHFVKEFKNFTGDTPGDFFSGK